MNLALSPQQRQALSRCPLFRSGGQAVMDRALEQPGCWVEDFPAGAEIYRPDRFHRSLGVVLSGRVRVTKDALPVSELEAGELFGAAALYTTAVDYATTLTVQVPCRCLFLEEALLDQLLEQNPQLRHNYLAYLTGRIHFLSSRLQFLAAGDTHGRLVRYLLANEREGAVACPAADLARRLGISRASLYRAFQDLERAGLIVRTGRTIRIPDSTALEAAL